MKRGQGSFSSRSGAAWDRSGADTRKRSERKVLDHTAAGHFGRVSPLSEQAVRTAIAAQTCPWCGAGPYKNLALHTNVTHGVSAAELRKMAGYSTRVSICAPELSDNRRDHLMKRPDRQATSRKGTAAAVAAGAQRKASAEWSAKSRERSRDRDDLIVRRYHEGRLFKEIADEIGIHEKHVANVLRRMGIDLGDGRSERFRNDEFRTKATQNLRKGLDVQRQKRERLKATRLARYAELGANWAAIEQMATEWGVSHKTAAGYLKTHGALVPDGRKRAPGGSGD